MGCCDVVVDVEVREWGGDLREAVEERDGLRVGEADCCREGGREGCREGAEIWEGAL